jgi:Uma2 family endonuclease
LPIIAARVTRPEKKAKRKRTDLSKAVLFDGAETMPLGIANLDSFCYWAESDAFPRRGRFSFIRGQVWMDLEMDQIFFHNLLKVRFGTTIDQIVLAEKLGYFLSDRVLLRNDRADLGTEPDGLFLSMQALKLGLATFVKGAQRGYTRIDGTPDMALEVVSDGSVRKDTIELRERYWLAGIPEYWLVDGRAEAVSFDILKRGPRGYLQTRKSADGWVKSKVFQRQFRVVSSADEMGFPSYVVETKS